MPDDDLPGDSAPAPALDALNAVTALRAAPPDRREILHTYAIALQREVAVRCGFLPPKTLAEATLARLGPCAPHELDTVRYAARHNSA